MVLMTPCLWGVCAVGQFLQCHCIEASLGAATLFCYQRFCKATFWLKFILCSIDILRYWCFSKRCMHLISHFLNEQEIISHLLAMCVNKIIFLLFHLVTIVSTDRMECISCLSFPPHSWFGKVNIRSCLRLSLKQIYWHPYWWLHVIQQNHPSCSGTDLDRHHLMLTALQCPHPSVCLSTEMIHSVSLSQRRYLCSADHDMVK